MKRKGGSSGQITCYVIAYDIADVRRCSKAHQNLMGFGKCKLCRESRDGRRFSPG